jgi:hypothetical protein
MTKPRYRYDCERCKFSWTCGRMCSCALPMRLGNPPLAQQEQIDAYRLLAGLTPEFRLPNDT